MEREASGGAGGRGDGQARRPMGGGGWHCGPMSGGGRARCDALFSAVDVLLKAVGDTPIMRTKKWAVERTRTIQGLVDFIKKFLKLMASEQLVRAGTERGLRVQGPQRQTLQGHCWNPVYSYL